LGRLIATIVVFITGGFFATGARWLGIERNDLIIAIALIGAGIQCLVLICLYLYRTREKPAKVPFGEPLRLPRDRAPRSEPPKTDGD
jgi:type VI protein secretion system component VasK